MDYYKRNKKKSVLRRVIVGLLTQTCVFYTILTIAFKIAFQYGYNFKPILGTTYILLYISLILAFVWVTIFAKDYLE